MYSNLGFRFSNVLTDQCKLIKIYTPNLVILFCHWSILYLGISVYLRVVFWQHISLFLGAVERRLVCLSLDYKFLSQIEVKGECLLLIYLNMEYMR